MLPILKLTCGLKNIGLIWIELKTNFTYWVEIGHVEFFFFAVIFFILIDVFVVVGFNLFRVGSRIWLIRHFLRNRFYFQTIRYKIEGNNNQYTQDLLILKEQIRLYIYSVKSCVYTLMVLRSFKGGRFSDSTFGSSLSSCQDNV